MKTKCKWGKFTTLTTEIDKKRLLGRPDGINVAYYTVECIDNFFSFSFKCKSSWFPFKLFSQQINLLNKSIAVNELNDKDSGKNVLRNWNFLANPLLLLNRVRLWCVDDVKTDFDYDGKHFRVLQYFLILSLLCFPCQCEYICHISCLM